MISHKIDIKTEDGICDSFIAYPNDGEKFPAVILYMDAFGPREYLFSMAEKMASYGYFVFLPNLLYRARRAPIIDVKFPLKAEDMPEARKQLMPFFQVFSPEKALDDAKVFLKFIFEQKQVSKNKIGVTGYCMGGSMAIRTAGIFPDQVAAAACFHGGNLASDLPDSPHKLLKNIKAELYIANADNDQSMPPEQIEKLRSALDDSQLPYKMELYSGAIHGFTMADLPAYNAGALQKHWDNLTELFSRTLL